MVKEYDYIVRKDGIKFYTKSDFFTLRDISSDYNISDLKDYPVAVDLGANIGGFCCRAAKVCKRVLALEPVRFNELMDNMRNVALEEQAVEAVLAKAKVSEKATTFNELMNQQA